MAGSELPRDMNLEETRSAISDGLKACRAMVQSYRELLTDEGGGPTVYPHADNDARSSANDPD